MSDLITTDEIDEATEKANQDYEFIRSNAKETVKSGKQLLKTLEALVMSADTVEIAHVASAYTSVANVMTNNLRLIGNTHRDQAVTKQTTEPPEPQVVNNTINLIDSESISVSDVVSRLKESRLVE